MRCFKYSLAAACSLVIAVAATSPAMAAFQWAIEPSPGDPLVIHLRNFEPAPATVAADGYLYGVGVIDMIESPDGTAWAKSSTQELTMVFRNYAYDGVVSTPASLFFTGGVIDVYFDGTPDAPNLFGPVTDGDNTDPDQTANNVFENGDLMLTLNGHAGIPGGYTLVTAGDPNVFAQGNGYLDVVAGSGPMAGFFDGDSIPTLIPGDFADMNFRATLTPNPSAGPGDYPILSSDPIFTQFVPEPMSVAVWSGLVCLAGAIAYRKSRLAI